MRLDPQKERNYALAIGLFRLFQSMQSVHASKPDFWVGLSMYSIQPLISAELDGGAVVSPISSRPAMPNECLKPPWLDAWEELNRRMIVKPTILILLEDRDYS